MKRSGRKERGFTLMELVVVIIIIGVLAALVAPKFFGRVSEAKQKAAKAQIELFGTALDALRLDTGRYPTTEEGLKALREKPSGIGNVERTLPSQRNPRRSLGKTLCLQMPGCQWGLRPHLSTASTAPREEKEKTWTSSAGRISASEGQRVFPD